LANAGSADLPNCFDYFSLPNEKRYGHRKVVWATVVHPLQEFRLATAHLEVRNKPACRARQMIAALEAIPEGPCWFAGDWNTHTFRRGGMLHTLGEFLRVVTTPLDRFDRRLLAPWHREPLFAALERAGFRYREWNEPVATAQQRLAGVEELDLLPAGFARTVTRLFRLAGRSVRMRLDWIAARGPWRAVEPGPALWTGVEIGPAGLAASDHAPIGIEAAWESPV
jgi:endonuclease/exonuclease/phosphatase family metal-dependent hydrolase